jgi:hypothetical protein
LWNLGLKAAAGLSSIVDKVKVGIGKVTGAIENAIKKVADTFAQFITTAMSKIRDLIAKARAKVMAALNKVGSGVGSKPKTEKPEDRPAVINALVILEGEQQKYLQNGKISKSNAEKVVAGVKSKTSVFKVLKVVDGGSDWDYYYEASPSNEMDGPEKLPEDSDKPNFTISYKWDTVVVNHLYGERKTGSEPNTNDADGNYQVLKAADYTSPKAGRNNWVRMHVFNEKLGGSGNIPDNLVMGPHSSNHSPNMKTIEDHMKSLVDKNEVVSMKATKIRSSIKFPAPLGSSQEGPTRKYVSKVEYEIGTYTSGNWQSPKITYRDAVIIDPPAVTPIVAGQTTEFPVVLSRATPLLMGQAYFAAKLGSVNQGQTTFTGAVLEQLRQEKSQEMVINKIDSIKSIQNKPNVKQDLQKMFSDKKYLTL